jgi:Ran GTPase-activating protein (RanGAP) involved in mRNA processing and transport
VVDADSALDDVDGVRVEAALKAQLLLCGLLVNAAPASGAAFANGSWAKALADVICHGRGSLASHAMQSGMVVALQALLDENPGARETVRAAVPGIDDAIETIQLRDATLHAAASVKSFREAFPDDDGEEDDEEEDGEEEERDDEDESGRDEEEVLEDVAAGKEDAAAAEQGDDESARLAGSSWKPDVA